MLRWLLLLLVGGVLLVPSTAQASGPDVFPDVRLSPNLRLLAPSGVWGGEYTVPSGEHVRVFTSDDYPRDDQLNQNLANFLDSALHGAEIETVTIYRYTTAEIEQVCGSAEALACYAPDLETIWTPAEPETFGFSAESALLHEYGHHVANARSNAPWSAINTGPKRWATYLNVCAEDKRGHMFPGAEDLEHYSLNPGEGWAESYRVLNEQRLGLTPSPWQAVDELFQPDARALQLIAQDVLQPWKPRAASTLRGRLGAGRARTYRISTPLDGNFRVSGPKGLKLTVLGPSSTLKSGARSVNTQVCGQRTLRVRVSAKRATSYQLKVTKP